MSINYYQMSSTIAQKSMSPKLRSTIIGSETAKNLPIGHEVNYNSSGFRCDEFKTEHDLPHFLFVGCSITFGDAVPVEYSWPYRTHEYLKNTYGSSGFYNVSALGNSIGDCVTNVMKYISFYGKPDAIFFGVPDPTRLPVDIDGAPSVITLMPKGKDYEVFLSVDKKHKVNPFLKISFDYYLILDQFCKSNNIKLFATQVGPPDDDKFFDNIVDNFSSFALCNQNDMLNFLRSTEKGKDKYYLKGSDDMHPGTGSHLYWSEMFIERIKSEKLFNK
jgi:hypothetical protein